MDILALDIGNSRTTAAWVSRRDVLCMDAIDGYAAPALRRLLRTIARDGARSAPPRAIALCSVVPARTAKVAAVAAELFPGVPQLRTGWDSVLGIPVDLAAPAQTGADRYADAVAAAALYPRAAVIVCDFGTASTFNLVLPDKGFCGGAIAPGYAMWLQALGRGTAQLPIGAADALATGEKGDPGIGRDTAGALRAGRSWGFRGMVTEIIWQLSKRCGRRNPVIMATGGWAHAVSASAGFAMDVVPDLTLLGTALIAERSLKPASSPRPR